MNLRNLYTPGPWITKESTEHFGRVNVTVCAASTANEIATAWQGTSKVNRANARLIACAPEMIDTLRWWIKQMQDDNVDDIGKLLDEMTDRARKITNRMNDESRTNKFIEDNNG